MAQRFLIVDDNRTYATWTESLLHAAGYQQIDFAESGISGLATIAKAPNDYVAVFSDITMEHPGAGLFMVPKLRKAGFRGVVVLESTGFDYPIVFWLSKWTLKMIGVDGLVIKREMLKEGKFKIHWISQNIGNEVIEQKMKPISTIPGWKPKLD